MIHYITDNLWLGKYHSFTDEEMELADREEQDWKALAPHYKEKELLEIFPEAKPILIKNLKEKIKLLKTRISNFTDSKRQLSNIVAEAPLSDQWFWQMVAEVIYLDDLPTLQRDLKSLTFKLAALKSKETISRGYTEAQIEQAKSIKLEDVFSNPLRNVGGRMVGRCPFHQDKIPSFTIYPHQNSFYCYSCCQGGDIIKYVELQQQCDFKNAIKYLLGS